MKRLALVYLGAGTFFGQPMGLLFLAAWLKKHSLNWEVTIIDANFKNVQDTLLHGKYDAIGISSMSQQYEEACTLATILKHKGIGPIIIGGVHVSTLPESIEACFDVAILNEGEVQLASYLNTGIVGDNSVFVDLCDYPDLDYNLLSNDYFKPRPIRIWQKVVTEAMLITSRGCPYSCRFCSTTNFWKKYRAHEAEWVIRQMQQLAAKGVTHIQIFDDLFTVSKKRLLAIAEQFERAQLYKQIQGISTLSRANVFDQDICDALKRMNVKSVTFGFESGSERVLKYLKKDHASVSINKQAVRLAKKNDFRVVGSMMVGSPHETVLDIFKSIKFIWWGVFHGIEDLWPFITVPYPGTEFWDIAVTRKKVSSRMNFNKLTMQSKVVGDALLIDINYFIFAIMWALIQVSLLPFKIRKGTRLVMSIVKSLLTRKS